MANLVKELRATSKVAAEEGLFNWGVMLDAAQRVEKLEAIVATLPKCWRLDDGELVQDYLVVPDVDLWAVPLSGIVYQWWVQFVGINGRLRGLFHDAITEEHVDRCANSREAAKAMAAKQRKDSE